MKPKINKTSWKSRNFLKVKVDDVGGRVYNDYEVPAAIKYITSEEIKWKNTESAYNPIKFEGNQFSLPTAYRKRPNKDASHSMIISDNKNKDSKAISDYAREVSKRVRVLKCRLKCDSIILIIQNELFLMKFIEKLQVKNVLSLKE